MRHVFPVEYIEPFYSTYRRASDGALVTNRGQVIGPPTWTAMVIAGIEKKLDIRRDQMAARRGFSHHRVGRA